MSADDIARGEAIIRSGKYAPPTLAQYDAEQAAARRQSRPLRRQQPTQPVTIETKSSRARRLIDSVKRNELAPMTPHHR